MADISDYLENEIISFFLRNDANTFTPPATLYLALFTADPTDTGSFTNEVPDTPNTYARQTVAFNAAASGSTANTADVVFADMPASTVTHFAVVDSGTHATGNVLMHGDFTASVSPGAGDTVTVSAGNLTITFD